MNPIVIGFCGKIGAGKTTAARQLETLGYTRLRFADPLKAMLRAAGLSSEEVDGALKETPCAFLCGQTPRHAMQTLGTEWGRDLIGGDFWVNAWLNALDQVAPVGRPNGHDPEFGMPSYVMRRWIAVDDVRFPNEVAAIHALGGIVVEVRRGDLPPASGHVSEHHALEADHLIDNDGSRADLAAAVAAIEADFWVKEARTSGHDDPLVRAAPDDRQAGSF